MKKTEVQPQKSWLMRMICCSSAPQPEPQPKRLPKKAIAIKKKAKIQLSLIGSTSLFSLCKMTRKNIAIDAYKFRGVLPNPVNRYLSERIRGQVGLFKGEMSSILWRNITCPTKLFDRKEDVKMQVGCDALLGGVNCYRKGIIDYYVYCPKPEALKCLLENGINQEFPIAKELQQICLSSRRTVIVLPAEVVLDQLGIVLPSLPDKEIEVESIMVSGKCISQVVYIGEREYIRIREDEKVDFIVKELSVSWEGKEESLRTLMELLLQHLGIGEIVKMLVDSIGDSSSADPLLTCFLRNVVISGAVSESELQKLFKWNELTISQTPNLARTGSFGVLTTAKLSIRDQSLLNRGNDLIKHSFEVDTEQFDEFTLKMENSEFSESFRNG